MANATVFDSTPTNPGGTGSTITVTLPTHAVGDIIYIEIGNSGNTLWTGNPAGWNRIQQVQVGTAANGLVGTWFWRKVLSGDSLPLANPVFTLGATVTREAFAKTLRGADFEGPFTLPEWVRAYNTGTANPVRPTAITTPAPEGLVNHTYFQRSATNTPDPSGYTQDEEIVISGTLVGNSSHKSVADQQTALTNQDASPTSGVRWVAGIVCVPSPDYVYYRAGAQALTASGTSATPALPTGTSSSDNAGRKDLIIATVECAGTPTIAPNTPADWTQITGEWVTTTSGNGTTVRKYWTLYDGTLDRQFNRSSTGEILVYLSTYRNADQANPIGALETQQNASATSSAFPSLIRTETKSTVQITCIADGTPTFTAPAGFTERNDSNGVTCADQSFNAGSTINSASFTLSTASPTVAGQLEILSAAGVATGPVLLADDFNDNSRDTAKWALGSIAFENAGVGVAETNQQIEITPLALTGTPAIYGYKSVNAYDFTGREASVRIAADIDPNTEAWLVVAIDADNYFRVWVASGNLQTRSRVAANNSNQSHGSFSFATHPYWRIRHDNSTDEIVWEYSADRITWTELRRLARPVTITSVSVYLSGGTGSSIASPGLVKFDDFFLRDPPHLLAIQDGSHAHASGSPTLTQVHELTTAASSHAHSAGNLVLEVSTASLIAQYGGTRRGVFSRIFSGVN